MRKSRGFPLWTAHILEVATSPTVGFASSRKTKHCSGSFMDRRTSKSTRNIGGGMSVTQRRGCIVRIVATERGCHRPPTPVEIQLRLPFCRFRYGNRVSDNVSDKQIRYWRKSSAGHTCDERPVGPPPPFDSLRSLMAGHSTAVMSGRDRQQSFETSRMF
jgi:hypothetical protein